ncbi:MAG TPA: hypothetical protein V6D05_00550, partial [Stenomitos sp.]
MKLQMKLGMAFAGTLTVVALAGCPNMLPTSTTDNQSPAPSTQPLSLVSGRITFDGGEPGAALTLGLKKFNGSTFDKLTVTTTTDTKGNYAFTDTSLTAGKYQVFYDDGGQVMSAADVNTVGAYISAAVDASASATQSVNFDVKWLISPTITPGATYQVGTSSFGWAANTNAPNAEYQVLVADAASSSVFSSAFKTRTSLDWNGKRSSANDTDKDTPTGSALATGKYYYQIKFQKAGTTFLGQGFYGQTKWIP